MPATKSYEVEPLMYRIEDATKASGLSRSTLYELIADGTLESRKVAGRRLIPASSLKRFLGIALEDGARAA